MCWLLLLLLDHCLLPRTEDVKVSFKKGTEGAAMFMHQETGLSNIRIKVQKAACWKMHIERSRGRKYALLQLNSKNLRTTKTEAANIPRLHRQIKNRRCTTKLKRQPREIKFFSPHNPFPDKQTSGFQIPHRLPPRGRPRYWPCGLPAGRKW